MHHCRARMPQQGGNVGIGHAVGQGIRRKGMAITVGNTTLDVGLLAKATQTLADGLRR